MLTNIYKVKHLHKYIINTDSNLEKETSKALYIYIYIYPECHSYCQFVLVCKR